MRWFLCFLLVIFFLRRAARIFRLLLRLVHRCTEIRPRSGGNDSLRSLAFLVLKRSVICMLLMMWLPGCSAGVFRLSGKFLARTAGAEDASSVHWVLFAAVYLVDGVLRLAVGLDDFNPELIIIPNLGDLNFVVITFVNTIYSLVNSTNSFNILRTLRLLCRRPARDAKMLRTGGWSGVLSGHGEGRRQEIVSELYSKLELFS